MKVFNDANDLQLWTKINLKQDGEHFFALQEALIKGSTIKYIRLPDDVVSIALEYNKRQQNIRRQNRDLNQSSHRSSGKKIHRGGNSQKAGVPQGIAAAENPRKH